MSDEPELRARLDRLAASHAPDDVSFDAVVRRRDRRRARRRMIAVAAVFVVIIGAAGAIQLFDGDSGSDLDIAADDESVETTTTTTNAAPAETPAASIETGDVGASFYGEGAGWIVPWGTGFLTMGQVFEPSDITMQDLVPDIEERFSPEVIAALADTGTTDLEESIAVLTEAGLIDEATATVLDDPELMAAYNQVIAGGTYRLEVSVSDNGTDWTVVPDFATPGGSDYLDQVRSDGEHLLVAEQIWGEETRQVDEILVSSTTDLVTWTTATLPLAPPPVPDFVEVDNYLADVAIGNDGWYAMVNYSTWVDIWTLLPEDLRFELESQGYGWSPTPEGLVIESYPYDEEHADEEVAAVEADIAEPIELPEPDVIRTIPWSDLGLSYDDYLRYGEGREGQGVQAWVGGWDGSVAPAAGPPATDCCQVVGTDLGFIAVAWGGEEYDEGTDTFTPTTPRLFFSTDGQAWDPVSAPPGGGWIGEMVAVEGGVVTTTSDQDGSQRVWRADARGDNWQAVEIDGLPDGAYIWFGGSRARGVAAVIDAATYELEPYVSVGFEADFEADGIEIHVAVDTDGSIDVRLTELATETVVLERFDIPQEEALPDFLSVEGDALTFEDDAGEAIVTISQEAFFAGMDEAQQAAREASGFVEPDPRYEPDFWLVASIDGLSWHVFDLPVDDGVYGYGTAAVNGTTVVVRSPSSWLTFDIG